MNSAIADRNETLFQEVQARLDARRDRYPVDLKVVPEESRQDEEWLCILVAPRKSGIRAYDYVEVLSEVEEELRHEGHSHILLLPYIE